MLNHSKAGHLPWLRYPFADLNFPKNIEFKSYIAIIFDLDGVIIDSMPFHFQAWRKAFQAVGVDVTARDIYEREGENRETTTREIYRVYKGKYPSGEVTRTIISAKEEIYKKVFKFQMLPGVTDLLTYLKKNGIKLGLTTGSTSLSFDFQYSGKFLSNFDAIVSGNDPINCKPSPDPYLLTVKKLNVPNDACLVIENAPLGIRSALAAGLTCLAVKGTSPLPTNILKNAGAHSVYGSLVQIHEALLHEYC